MMPKQQFFSVADVCKRTGLKSRSLQFWDEQGIVIPIRGSLKLAGRRSESRPVRLYTAEQVELIGKLRKARQHFQLTLAEAVKLVETGLPVRVITEPVEINGVLIVPKRREK